MAKAITLAVGLLSLTIGISLVCMRVSHIKSGIVTTATVVGVESKYEDEEKSYRPVIRFINNRNEPMIFRPASYKADNVWSTGCYWAEHFYNTL